VLVNLLGLLKNPAFVTGAFLYFLASLVWFRVLSVGEVSTNYPVLVGITFGLVTLGAIVFFKESINFAKLAGIGIILAGVILISRS